MHKTDVIPKTKLYWLLQIARSIINEDDVVFQENTYKHYYYPQSDDDELPSLQKKESIEEFFEPPKKKQRTMRSSTVGRCFGRDSTSYVSTNTDDGASATHLIKIEVYDLKKIENIDQSDHWKHADVRVKYYTKSTNDDHHKKTHQLIYNITKGISNSPNCRKYSYNNKDKKYRA